jgi:hypothetical protein
LEPGGFLLGLDTPFDLLPDPGKVLLPGRFLHRSRDQGMKFLHRVQLSLAGGTFTEMVFDKLPLMVCRFSVKVFTEQLKGPGTRILHALPSSFK